jgi:hypothetical protein
VSTSKFNALISQTARFSMKEKLQNAKCKVQNAKLFVEFETLKFAFFNFQGCRLRVHAVSSYSIRPSIRWMTICFAFRSTCLITSFVAGR